ncbi:ankyrin repeat domain-containing protein [Blastopirellula sp. JC733]|nr:ankyrin repeat domain-containing protein [Blastopirellula sediminis]
MRTLLCLFAVAAAQAGFYFWRLRPSNFRWDSLTGIALVTLTIVFWSGVLQIAWRDKSERPDSPQEEPDSPSGDFAWRRTMIAVVFAALGIPATLFTWNWARLHSHDEVAQFCFATGLPIPVSPPTYTAVAPTSAAALSPLPRFDPFVYDDKQLVALNDMPILDNSFDPAPSPVAPDDSWLCFSFTPSTKIALQPFSYPGMYPSFFYEHTPHPLIKKHHPEFFYRNGVVSPSWDEYDAPFIDTSDGAQRSKALGHAIQMGNAAQVKELIDAGADLEAISPNSGRTPLEEAELCGQGKLVKLLKEAGAK